MATRIDIWTDFTCPYCFLITQALAQLDNEFHLKKHWRSYELHPDKGTQMPDSVKAKISEEYGHAKEISIVTLGIRLHPGPIGINTHAAHQLLKFAEERKLGQEIHNSLMKAYWLEEKNLEDKDVLFNIAADHGISYADLYKALASDEFTAVIEEDILEAHEYGIRAVPSVLIEDRYLLSGLQNLEAFKAAIRKAEKENRDTTISLGL